MNFPTPNTIVHKGTDFYVSYNDRDSWLYGCDTTAIVDNAMVQLILNGDHTKALKQCKTHTECIAYYNKHYDQRNKYSEA